MSIINSTMKKFTYILFVLVMTPFLFACDEDSDEEEDEVQRTSHTVTVATFSLMMEQI